MSSKFISANRNQPYLLPPSLQDWLPEDHLSRFVVDIVSQLDLQPLSKMYANRGSKAYHPEILLALLFYGYATGTFSSRKIEQATYDSVAFRYISANTHPDHDTIATFRKRFLNQLQPLFVQILMLAREMGLLKLGNVSLDGTKIKANASKHHAFSWGHACKLEKQLQGEVEELMQLAEKADSEKNPDGMDIPSELARRKDRLIVIAEAKEKIKQRVNERYDKEIKDYEEKIAERVAKAEKSGKKARGKEPKAPNPEPLSQDQVNLTDEESRIMPTSGKSFEQSYNAQAAVDVDKMFIVESHVSQAPNDKQELAPALKKLITLPEELGKIDNLLADAGYYSNDNVTICEKANVTPLIPPGREKHNQALSERFDKPADLPPDASPVDKMKYQLRTIENRKLYAKRKSTVEPVFGIIKHVMKFRQFLLRGVEAVGGEWTLVSIAWNIKRMFALSI